MTQVVETLPRERQITNNCLSQIVNTMIVDDTSMQIFSNRISVSDNHLNS